MAGLNWGESECSTKLLHTVQYYGLHTGILQQIAQAHDAEGSGVEKPAGRRHIRDDL